MSSRSRRMIDAVVKQAPKQDFQKVTAVKNSKSNDYECSYKPDVENSVREEESPLPFDADISEINQLMDLLSDSEILCENNNDTSSIDEEQLENITQHPSPDCSINHLDFDCDNHFCPWFIEKDILPQHSVASTYTDFVDTPQANTPLSSVSEPQTPQVSRNRKNNPRKDKGNIRRRHISEWKDNKRKILRNLGKEYESRVCHNDCRLKCSTKISDEDRLLIFNRFWGLGNREKQWSFIANLMVKQKKRRVFTDTNSRRNK